MENEYTKKTLFELQELVDDWIKENGGYWEPFAMLASVTEELGEIAREINHLEKVKVKKASEKENSLDLEMGDIIFSIMCIANFYKINLGEAFQKAMIKFANRDWNRFTNGQ